MTRPIVNRGDMQPSTVSTMLPRTPVDEPLVKRLSRKLDAANVEYDRVDRYYTGDQPLSFMAPEVRAQVGDRLAPLVINWPETIVDSVARRLAVEGFSLGRGGEADDELWRIFTANDMESESPLLHADTLVHGLSYLGVWGNDDDPNTPIMAVESAHQVTVEYEPNGRTVRAGLKRWLDGDTVYATVYLPDRVTRYAARKSAAGDPRWRVDSSLENTLGAVPLVPMVNRGRMLNRSGRSELASVAPIADGINKLATDMMVVSEAHGAPNRYATGIQIPVDAADRERLQAEAAAYWENATRKKTWLAGEGVSFGQFQAASLDGFVSGLRFLTSALAAIGGLPPEDLGLPTTNPASAEARRAAETTLILRAKEKQRTWGGSYARAMRLAVAARDGLELRDVPQEYARLQVDWAEAATPAIAQSMDAAVKGVEAGIYDREAAQEVVGMSPVQRAAVQARAEAAAARAATDDVRARMDLAEELQRDRGLTLNAAMAAAGLLQAASLNAAETASPQAP